MTRIENYTLLQLTNCKINADRDCKRPLKTDCRIYFGLALVCLIIAVIAWGML